MAYADIAGAEIRQMPKFGITVLSNSPKPTTLMCNSPSWIGLRLGHLPRGVGLRSLPTLTLQPRVLYWMPVKIA
jgi:hypothetical protein